MVGYELKVKNPVAFDSVVSSLGVGVLLNHTFRDAQKNRDYLGSDN